MIKSRLGVFLVFYMGNDERIPMGFMLPASDARLIKKYLGDKLEKINIPKGKRKNKAENDDSRAEKSKQGTAEKSATKRRREKSAGAQIETGSLFAGIICVIVGIIIALMGSLRIMGDMPAIVGGFPIGLGLMFIVLAFNKYEFVSAFLIKFCAAALLIFMGFMFLFVIENGVTKSPVTVSSLLRHPTVYALACLFFVSVGVSIIPNSVKSLIEYFKYR